MRENPVVLSEMLLQGVRQNDDVKPVLGSLSKCHTNELQFENDSLRKAFWLNIYNATVQYWLKKNPEVYNNRWAFYNKKAIEIAGRRLSPNNIEHGILRRSKWLYGLGYVQTLFPNGFEKRTRVNTLDNRIHFALNCGAKSCPPIIAYKHNQVDDQLNEVTKLFLQANTRVENNRLYISKLFLWYRGDFGGKQNVIKFLKDYSALPNQPFERVVYDGYDWTLKTDMYAD